MRTTFKKKAALAAAGALLLGIGVGIPSAHADYQPSGTDVVGVGGDTPQYALDFVADGNVHGAGGFNSANNVNKFVFLNATADANGRAAYLNGTSTNLNPTDVLRAGTNPVQRTQSSGDAISALLADTGTIHKIDYIASASLPTAGNQTTAANNGWGYLHVVQIGGDTIKIAAATTTNAPSGLSTAELLGIYNGTYTHWNNLPGNSGGSTDAIQPLIPPSTSTIYKNFIADLTTANGGTAPTLVGTTTVEQNDPSAVTSPDQIVPFSSARLALYNAGYFYSPNSKFPGATSPLSAGIQLLTGTPPDSTVGTPTTAYVNNAKLYIIFRESDASDAPWEPGSSLNWVQALFSSSTGTPYFEKAAGQALIQSAGDTATYNDIGDPS